MRKLKVLELFSGTGSISKAFEERGHETVRIDWDEKMEADWHVDIGKLTAEKIVKRYGWFDVIWASPECTTYSVAAISKHRRKDPEWGGLVPISEYGKQCDRINVNLMRIIRDMQAPAVFIENPRAAFRKMDWIQWIPRHTVTYCQYQTELPLEQRRMKPTDIFCTVPNPKFKPPCQNGDPCHVKAPRGSTTGTQGMKLIDKFRIPDELCRHVVTICEDYISRLDKANEFLVSQGLEPITPHWGEDIEPTEPQQRLLF